MGMRELTVQLNENGRITSVELVEIINTFRQIEKGEKYKELLHKSIMTKIRNEIETLKTLGLDNKEDFKKSTYKNNNGQEYNCFSLNSQAVRYIMDSCRSRDKIAISKVFNMISNGKEISVCKNRPEYDFIDGLVNAIKPFGIVDYETQYTCCNNKYRIDLYIPSLNIAIEYDENEHKHYTYEQQELRQKLIEKELGCRFVRVSDKDDLFYNIGYVIKEIMDSLKFRSQNNITEVI